VRQQKELAAALPPHNSVPWHGFVSTGNKVLKDFQLLEDLPFLQAFTATVYSGAQILSKIALLHPHLTTSPKVVQLTLQTESTAWQERMNILDSLRAIGNYTMVFDVTFGHKDSFKRFLVETSPG
jgi:hypothetical protein